MSEELSDEKGTTLVRPHSALAEVISKVKLWVQLFSQVRVENLSDFTTTEFFNSPSALDEQRSPLLLPSSFLRSVLYLWIHLCTIYFFIYLFVYLFIYLFIIYLFIYLLFVCVYFYLF